MKHEPMRIFLGCEASGCVRRAWAEAGHHVVSCDLRAAEDGAPDYTAADFMARRKPPLTGWHHRGDVFRFLKHFPPGYFDLAINHPPCTYLAYSGVRWLYHGGRRGGGRNEWRWKKMYAGAQFFTRLHTHRAFRRSVTENPKMHGYAQREIGIPWAQHFQPWQFGHEEVKDIFLWLNGVPQLRLLARLNVGPPPPTGTPEHRRWAVVHHAAPGDDRDIERSAFFPGIAREMARQWGAFLARDRLTKERLSA